MLLELNQVDTNLYKKDFMHSFQNFLNKCPIIFKKVELVDKTIYIYLEEENPLIFVLDLTIHKQDQIAKIKNKLENFYPIIFETKSVRYSSDEIIEMTNNGISLEEALNKKKIVYNKRFKILRTHNKTNELDIWDERDFKLLKYKLKVPIAYFLTQIEKLKKEEVYTLFIDNSIINYEIKKGN